MPDPSAFLDTLVTFMTTWGLRVVGAVAVLVIGRVLASWARRLTRKGLERSRTDPTLVPFLGSLVYYVLLALVGIAVLGLFGIPTASFVAILGAAGLAIGLALQGTLSNFAAGVMLLIFRPFKLGDFVEAGGNTGVIREIGIFSTALDSPDNVRITVPNSQIYGATIKNYTANEARRVDLEIGISYDDDIRRARETIEAVVAAEPRVLADPPLQVAVGELGDSSVNLVVRPWCRPEDYWDVRFALLQAIKEGLEGAGCSIPYPQADVHLYQAQAD